MIYSIPYVVLIAFFEFLGYIYYQQEEETTKRRVVALAVLVYFVFIGFRGFIFSDWINYLPYFESCTTDKLFYYDPTDTGMYEPGFTTLVLLCKGLFDNYHFFVFVTSVINLALLLNFFRGRVNNIPLALALYLVFDGFTISINLMRNAISILLFLNALRFLEERKPIPYFLLCLLALTFHATALIYFPLYFFFHRGYNRWVYLGVFVAGNVIFLLNIHIFLSLISMLGIGGEFVETKITMYTEYYSSSVHLSIGYLERLMTGTLVFLYYDKLKEIRKENVVFINALLAYFVSYFFFSEFSEISRRLSTIFIFSYWILWIDLAKCFAVENNRKIFMAFLSIYCLIKVVGITRFTDMDYDNILFGNIKSYEERLYIHNRNYVEPD